MVGIIILVTSVIGIALVGVLVLLNNPKSATNRLFAILAASLVIWPVFNYFSLATSQHLLFMRLVMVSATLIMGSFYFLAHVFPDAAFKLSLKYKIAIEYLLLTMALSMSPWLFIDVQIEGQNLVPQAGPAIVLFMGLLIYFLPAGFIYLYKKMKTERNMAVRKQTSYLLYGSLLMFGSILVLNFALPVIFADSRFVTYGPLLNLVFLGIIAYSMMHHALFDIKFYVVRATAYIFSQLLLSVILILPTTWLILHILGVSTKGLQFVAIALIGLVLIGLYRYLLRFFDQLTSKIFLRNYYEPQEVLNALSDVLVTSVDVVGIEEGSKVLRTALRASALTYWLRRTTSKEDLEMFERLFARHNDTALIVDHLDISPARSEDMRKRNIAVVAQLRTRQGRLGYMTFGYKESGQMYSMHDARFIGIAADDIAIALQNAIHFEEINNFNQTLKEKVETATHELRQTNKRLKQMDQTKDEFISLTSHQLRTPLTTIKGYISMLLDGDAGELQPQQRKLLEEAFNSSQRMVHLISDFLNISRIQTGKFMIELTDVNLADILDEEIEQLRISVKAHQMNLSYDKPADFPVMPLDDSKIRQVMMNFMDNAIYYSPPGSTITVTLSHTASTVEFKVIDQGIGVPKAEQHKLFAKFSRASNAKKQRPDGTGIGLFMAKKVIVALGGAIIFESEEGKGSTFGFRLNRPKS